jgi:hypothetical protein
MARTKASIRFELDEDLKERFELLLTLKKQSIAENLRAAIQAQVDEHADLIQAIQDRFQTETNDDES